MIFSIPRSKSFMEYFSYQKHHHLHSQISKHQTSPIRLSSHMPKSKQLYASQSQNQTPQFNKYIQTAKKPFKQSPKKQLIYNKCKSKSYDKYLNENKKKVHKQILLKNLNPEEKRIYQDSEENKNIYSGKKLVDPFNQKFNYFIKQENKQPEVPFLISEFLLEPCKINSKRIQHRPFTSQSFINVNFEAEKNDLKQKKHARNRTTSSMARTYQQSWRTSDKNKSMRKINQNMGEFSSQLLSIGSKFQSKHFCVEPWQLDPTSNNLDSIRIQ